MYEGRCERVVYRCRVGDPCLESRRGWAIVRNDSDTRTFSIFIKGKCYACLSWSSRLEYRLFVRAAVFLWIVLVQEILSRRPQTLRYSVSAVATSFAVIASKNALDWSLIRRFRHWFMARRFAFCRTVFFAEIDWGTVELQIQIISPNRRGTRHYPKIWPSVNPQWLFWLDP